jgi:hypothetical protein
LLAKPTLLNINLSSDRFSIFNKERDIPTDVIVGKIVALAKAGEHDADQLAAHVLTGFEGRTDAA